MTTPQDSPRRRKQKARRTKQLNEWRLKQATQATEGAASPAKKAAPPKAAVPKAAPKASAGAAAAKKSK